MEVDNLPASNYLQPGRRRTATRSNGRSRAGTPVESRGTASAATDQRGASGDAAAAASAEIDRKLRRAMRGRMLSYSPLLIRVQARVRNRW